MIKTLLIVGILAITIAIGCVINNYLLVRFNIYTDFKDIIKSIKSEISFLKTEKTLLLKKQNYKNKFTKEFISKYIETGVGDIYYLKPHENEELNTLLNSIGKSDIDGEINNLTYYENFIQKKCTESEEKYTKYGAFSIKMSIILGTLIAIILL